MSGRRVSNAYNQCFSYGGKTKTALCFAGILALYDESE